eukprot:1193639-Prorocentrum_minimum.AAC.1
MVVRVVRLLVDYGGHAQEAVSVLSFYNGQRAQCERELTAVGYPRVACISVDAMQGREVDVVVLSCVRSERQLGFLSDWRRVNVALSRAKEQLVVIGAYRTLRGDSYWARAMENMRRFAHEDDFEDHYRRVLPAQWAAKAKGAEPRSERRGGGGGSGKEFGPTSAALLGDEIRSLAGRMQRFGLDVADVASAPALAPTAAAPNGANGASSGGSDSRAGGGVGGTVPRPPVVELAPRDVPDSWEEDEEEKEEEAEEAGEPASEGTAARPRFLQPEVVPDSWDDDEEEEEEEEEVVVGSAGKAAALEVAEVVPDNWDDDEEEVVVVGSAGKAAALEVAEVVPDSWDDDEEEVQEAGRAGGRSEVPDSWDAEDDQVGNEASKVAEVATPEGGTSDNSGRSATHRGAPAATLEVLEAQLPACAADSVVPESVVPDGPVLGSSGQQPASAAASSRFWSREDSESSEDDEATVVARREKEEEQKRLARFKTSGGDDAAKSKSNKKKGGSARKR